LANNIRPLWRGSVGRFQSCDSAWRTAVFRLRKGRHRDQRVRKKTEAILVFIIMVWAI